MVQVWRCRVVMVLEVWMRGGNDLQLAWVTVRSGGEAAGRRAGMKTKTWDLWIETGVW